MFFLVYPVPTVDGRIFWRFSVEVDIFSRFLLIPIVYLHVVSNILQGGARVLSSTIG